MAKFETYFDNETNTVRVPDSQLTLEWLAVLSAKNIPYHVAQEDAEWIIELDETVFPQAISEITAYESERGFFDILKRKREGRLHFDIQRSDLSIIIGLLMILFYVISGSAETKSLYHQNGTLSGFKVFDGEWWRVITALTLHSDVSHILGNTIFLIIFASSACFSFGAGFAWLFIVLSGIIGNYLTISSVWPANHCAIGASTAVFGALGIIGAYSLAKKVSTRRFHYTSIIPLISAIGILAITGVAHGSDVRAHLLGFVSGVILGLCAFFLKLEKLKENYVLQLIPFLMAAALVAFAWYQALQA